MQILGFRKYRNIPGNSCKIFLLPSFSGTQKPSRYLEIYVSQRRWLLKAHMACRSVSGRKKVTFLHLPSWSTSYSSGKLHCKKFCEGFKFILLFISKEALCVWRAWCFPRKFWSEEIWLPPCHVAVLKQC